MFASPLKSRPIYPGLSFGPAMMHLMVADTHGADAILDLSAQAPAGFFECAHILFVFREGRQKRKLLSRQAAMVDRLKALGPKSLYEGPTLIATMPRLVHMLSTAHMGTRLYIAGTEGLICQTMKVALDAGMELDAIVSEHRGSAARRVQCVHCKGITEDVRVQPVACAHCGLKLFVRDHYSRRIAAFQGVRVDAEEPGSIPAVVEAFQ